MKRLSPSTLGCVPRDFVVPRYDRGTVRTGVVHLGLGAFHRAHQAAVFEAALCAGDMRWGVLGASLRSAKVRDDLNAQGGLYTLVTRDHDIQNAAVIGAIKNVLVAPEDPGHLVRQMSGPNIDLVTLTVTEKGYHLDPAGNLAVADRDVQADLGSLRAPRTAVGFITGALQARRAARLAPFTVLSCDNLPANGEKLRAAVLQMAQAHDPALSRWIEQEGAFPSSMVDRIVPASEAQDIAALAARLGIEDHAMVKTEPFFQWVIEDQFCGPRPDFTALGVQLTDDVAPWETAKLRLLNGAHSAIAYLGGLAGLDFVHEAVDRPEICAFVEKLWNEAAETLQTPGGMNLDDYRWQLLERFRNPALQHRTRQIAQDGSQKLPQRLLAPLAWRRERGIGTDALNLAIAAWIRWQAGRDDAGNIFVVEDPQAARLKAILASARSPRERVDAVVAESGVVPPGLADEQWIKQVSANLETLERIGSLATLRALPVI